MRDTNQEYGNQFMDRVQHILVVVLMGIIVLFLAGELFLPSEHTLLSTNCREYICDWERVMPDGNRVPVEVMQDYDVSWGEWVAVETTIANIERDTWFCIRSNQQDYRIFVDGELRQEYSNKETKYSLQGTTQGRYLTGGVPPVRFSM